jgi:hypothetical protein
MSNSTHKLNYAFNTFITIIMIKNKKTKGFRDE